MSAAQQIQIHNKLVSILDRTACPINNPLPAHRIKDDLGFDSIEIWELLMMVEDEFDIKMYQPEVREIKTVQQLVDLICTKLNDKEKDN